MKHLAATHFGLTSRTQTVAAVALLTILWLAMLVGGTGPLDWTLLNWLYAGHRPAVRSFARAVTVFGEWQTVISVSVLAAGWLLYRGKVRSALLLAGITLTGRALVHMLKVGVDRQRPDAFDHLVDVQSLSFPSAHAANSMILLLSLAMIAVPRHYRRWSVPLALICTFLVGLSRPMLGVHWPSDVIGGWSFGAAWVLALVAIAGRWPAEEFEPPRR